MSNPLDNEDYVAGALAATTGDLEVKPVAGGNYESTVYQWYRVYDTRSDECRAVLAGDNDDGGTPFCEPCDPDSKTEFTKAFIKTLRFGGSEDDPSSWTCILEDGWVDQEWIDLQVLRPILEKGAAELGTDFDFDVWAVKGVLGKKPKGKKRKQAEP
jgi:hypothetical protein